jgi:subtilisin family serine protease
LLGLALATAQGLGAALGGPGVWQDGDAPDQVLVLWRASPSSAELGAEAARLGQPAGRGLERLRLDLDASLNAQTLRDTPLILLHHVRLAASGPAAVEAAIAGYRASALVASAEPDPPVHAASCPYPLPLNAGLYAQGAQPGLTDTAWPQAMAAYCAGSVSLVWPITVAVLDSGIEASQPGLGGRVLGTGANFSDDPGGTGDDLGHGTFCAGLIAAGPVAGAGLYGAFLEPAKISLLPVKVLDACGSGDMGGLASGIAFAVQQGARVITMSLEGGQGTDTLEAAVNVARDANVVMVAAAGNDSGTVGYPAAYAPVISVAALDHTDAPASYSNFGKVDLSAPGGDGLCYQSVTTYAGCEPPDFSYGGPSPAGCVQVWSLSALYSLKFCQPFSASHGACGNPDGYALGSGTSFAAPLVAAAAALLLSQDSSRSSMDVYQQLLQSAAPTALGPGFHSSTGWGKLDFEQALNPTFHAPGAVARPGIYNYPNPFNPSADGLTTFNLQLTGQGQATLDIFDAGDQLVRHWELASHAGLQFLSWDGRNGRGQIVANGGYRAVLTQGGARAMAKVAVLQ